jgi:hypothetical protein
MYMSALLLLAIAAAAAPAVSRSGCVVLGEPAGDPPADELKDERAVEEPRERSVGCNWRSVAEPAAP